MVTSADFGRFDRSFVVRMIRDFFLSLLLLTFVEIGFRALTMLYDFQTDGRRATQVAAQNLAADVKSIMLNRGGPTAARTVYPILRRNHQDIGLAIAIEPTQVTVDSIRSLFNFSARGLAPEWESGRHHEVRVALAAEPFCLQCHFEAEIGDALGHVTVRNYLFAYVQQWWEEARMISLTGMVDIIWHTIILYILLKVRMAPLLALRAVVGRLAKGEGVAVHRTPVRSDDEFGELAADLNHFLERVNRLGADIDGAFLRFAAVAERLEGANAALGTQLERLRAAVRGGLAGTLAGLGPAPGGESGEPGRVQALLERLQGEDVAGRLDADERASLGAACQALGRLQAIAAAFQELDAHGDRLFELRAEYAAIRERLRALTDFGAQLSRRLLQRAGA